jgi:hypothetical protein
VIVVDRQANPDHVLTKGRFRLSAILFNFFAAVAVCFFDKQMKKNLTVFCFSFRFRANAFKFAEGAMTAHVCVSK